MFSGLITQTGKVTEKRTAGAGAVLSIAHAEWDTPVADGESIAVQGVCLTVTRMAGGCFCCDVLAETLTRSNLGQLAAGDTVNLERALRLEDRLGGHLVSGHIDGMGLVERVTARGRDHVLRVSVDPALAQDMVLKGSVCVDGASLTISAVDHTSFEVNLVPFTWEHTTLKRLRPGERVNIETDMIGKYVRRYLEGREARPASSDATIESALLRSGFC